MLVALDADDLEKRRAGIFPQMDNDLLQVIFAVRPNQVPRHPKACPTLQADTHRTTDRMPNKSGHN